MVSFRAIILASFLDCIRARNCPFPSNSDHTRSLGVTQEASEAWFTSVITKLNIIANFADRSLRLRTGAGTITTVKVPSAAGLI